MSAIVLPAGLVSVNDLKDRSAKLSFETRELSNPEFIALRDIRGTQGWLAFSMNEIQEEEIPTEMAETGTKSPSQRLRSVLFLMWKQEKSLLDFDVWYRSKMETLIQNIKNKLD